MAQHLVQAIGLFLFEREIVKLSSKVFDIPAHVATGGLEVGSDQTLRCPSRDTACADAKRLSGF